MTEEKRLLTGPMLLQVNSDRQQQEQNQEKNEAATQQLEQQQRQQSPSQVCARGLQASGIVTCMQADRLEACHGHPTQPTRRICVDLASGEACGFVPASTGQHASPVKPACWAHSILISLMIMHCLCSLALQTPFDHMSKLRCLRISASLELQG